MEEETRDPSSKTGLEHVSDGSVQGCENRETIQNSESDLSTMDVEEVELDMEESMPPDGVSGKIVQPLTETAHPVITRACRLVKQVNRLIQKTDSKKTLLHSPSLSLLRSKAS